MSDSLVVLQIFSTLPEAEIVKAYLAEQGIEAFLADKHLNTMYAGAVGGITGGYRLRVRKEDEALAQKLLLQAQDQASE